MSGGNTTRTITLEAPAAIKIGAGSAAEIGRFATARGVDRVLVVTGPFNAGRVDRLGLTCHVEVFADLEDEPDMATLAAARTAAERTRPDLVVGFGGGSAMDLAKLVAVLAGCDRTIGDMIGKPLPARQVLLAQVPTTAGTGSEAGTRALVSDHGQSTKIAFESPEMLADLAVLDPTLAVTLPPDITAETGVDALAHCVEAFTSARAHPAIDLYAREGIRLIGRHLRRAVTHGDDLDARMGMAMAALYGGYCLGPVNTTAGHAIAYPLSTRHGVPHGRANAIIFPHAFAFNATAVPDRTGETLALLGIDAGDTSALFDATHDFCRRLGIDMSMNADGIGSSDLEAMAREAASIRRLLDHNPRQIALDDILAIYHAAI